MAQCKQTAQELIEAAFSPTVAVLCSPDAEAICRKNNLSFVELVQPFCRLNAEASLKDPYNQSFSVRNLRLVIKALGAEPPQPSLAKKMLSEAVSACQFPPEGCRTTVVKVRDCEVQLPSSLPWFEAYRDCFFDVAYPSDHEFTKHFLSCIFVVSSANANPVAELTKLSQQQHQLQHQNPSKLPKWFCPNIFKGYVLLFDIAEGDQTQTEAVFQNMKSTFPGSFCHLLQINSQPITQRLTTAVDGDGPHPPDPWSQFLTRQMDHLDVAEYDNSPRTPQDDSGFPNQLTEGSSELDLSQIPEVAVEVTENLTAPSVDVLLHPLSPETNEKSPNSTLDRIDKSLKMECVPEDETPLARPIHNAGVTWPQERPQSQPHGLCLSVSDMDRIRIFIHEFVIRGLLPFVERQMKFLNEAVATRKGLHRTIFSATRKWFVGAKPSAQGPNTPSNSVVYSQEATELQVRRLGDLAFMFQHYDLAYQAYHTAKRDFNNDQAWLYYAGALEMAALAVFMQGTNSQRQYPVHYMDSAINTYMNTCKSAQFAARTTLLSTECLKCKGMYGEAATQFIKMSSEDSDLRTALLLEQAAHCYMVMRTPMIRKYAFHIIFAGHRFGKAGQRKHALRAYKQAYQVFKAKGWSLAEDHINFTIGRQSCNLKQLDQALDAFSKLLSEGSEQPPSQQAVFLREYLFVYNQLSTQEPRADKTPYLLPMPVIEGQATKVILCRRPHLTQVSEGHILASSVSFDDDDDDSLWFRLEELAVLQMQGGAPALFRPTLQRLTDKTLNYQRLVAAMKEPVVVQVSMHNPWKIPLALMSVSLLWRFYSTTDQDEEKSITNDQEDGCKMSVGTTMIEAETIDDLVIACSETKKVELSLIPHHTGLLKILGVAYSLGPHLATATGNEAPEALNGQTTTSTFARGKQYIELKGPRLNNSKAEKVSQVYGPDHRLELNVVPPMPCLQVTFIHFPYTMLCGEIQQTTVEFRNVGEFAIEQLCVVSATPELFSFGHPLARQTMLESTSRSSVYSDFIGKRSETLIAMPSVDRVCRLPFPDDCKALLPGASYRLPLWIRGSDKAGTHYCNFLFYYESTDHSITSMKHRILRHRAPLIVSNSFSVEAIAMHSQTQLATDNASSLAIAVDVENLNEMQDSTITELSIIQVSSASQKWLLQPMGKTPLKEIPVSPRETAHLCFRAVHLQPHSLENDRSLMFSNIPFGCREIDSSASPCADFIHRSQLSLPPLEEPLPVKGKVLEEVLNPDLEMALHVGIVIVVIWKAFVVSPTGESSVVMGQHHLCVAEVNTSTATHPQAKPVEEKPPIRIIPDVAVPSVEPGPSAAVLSQLVQCTVQHPHRVQHDFSGVSRTCLARVIFLVHNCSPVDVQVVMDTSHPSESSTVAQSPIASSFAWVGTTHWTVHLASGQTRGFTLQAAFFAPGAYNVGGVWVGVRPADRADGPLTPQGPFTPSLIVVDNASHPS